MTTPTDMPIEDRLRAHFADRTAAVAIPGPEHDTRVADVRAGRPLAPAPDDELGRRRAGRGHHRRRRPLLVAAAAAVVIAIVTGVALSGRGEPGDDVRTDSSPVPTTDVPATTEAPPTTTVPEPVETTLPQVAPPPGGATGPIVGRQGILGSWNGSAWVAWRSGDAAPPDLIYQVVGLGGSPRPALGQAGVGCSLDDTPTVDVGLGADDSGVAVFGEHAVLPREVEVLDPSGDVYRQAAAEVAASDGVAQPNPTVTQVVRADLDGDGAAEVLVMAEQIADPSTSLASPGDWAAAFVRRVVGGEVRTSVIASQLTTEADGFFLLRHEVAAIADLNGDGRMELVLDQRYYEGSSTTVFEYRDGSLADVLTVGCGA